jgi:hypothetical protein
MEEIQNSELKKRLSTWLDIDVYEELTQFAKENAGTSMDKWDYGVAFRILLMKSKYADMIYELERRIRELENNQETKEISKVSKIPEGYYEEKVLGGNKTNGGSN